MRALVLGLGFVIWPGMVWAKPDMGLGLGVGSAWRFERTALIEFESSMEVDLVQVGSLYYRLGQFRFYFEHSRYSRLSSSGNLEVKQDTAQNQIGFRYRILDLGWGSPFLGLGGGWGKHKIITSLEAETSQLTSNAFFLWGAEVGYEASIWRGLFAEISLRLSYPQRQDVISQAQFQLGYIWGLGKGPKPTLTE